MRSEIEFRGDVKMDWEKTLENYGMMIEEKLKDRFRIIKKEAEKYHPFIAEVYSRFEEYTLRRGKRLASCCTLLTYRGYTGRIDDEILEVCVGIEMYRHCILIHDDIVDMDKFRRGGKTMHQIFMKIYDDRFGEGVAVFLGNIAYSLASQIIIDSGFLEEKVAESLSLLSRDYREVNESQILDLLFEYKDDVDVDEWKVMASKRAASLFKVAMLIGAVLGDAPNEDLKKLAEAAANIGYAFDIQDDIIDTFADEQQYGRPPCRDIILGKKPLHVICALNSTRVEESETLRGLLGKKALAQKDIGLIRDLIKKSGGLEEAKKISRKHSEKAKMLISQTGLDDDVKEFFYSLIGYVDESLDWYK